MAKRPRPDRTKQEAEKQEVVSQEPSTNGYTYKAAEHPDGSWEAWVVEEPDLTIVMGTRKKALKEIRKLHEEFLIDQARYGGGDEDDDAEQDAEAAA